MRRWRRKKRHSDFLTAKILFAVTLILFCRFCFLKVGELLFRAADAEGKNLINRMVSEQVQDCLGEFDGDFFEVSRDSEGKIESVRADTAKLNLLKARLTKNLSANLQNFSSYRLKIPLGSILGGAVFNGRGPNIPFWIEPYSSAEISFSQDFSSAGINSVHYKLSLRVQIKMTMLFCKKESINVIDNEFLLEDRLISGDVPKTIWGIKE